MKLTVIEDKLVCVLEEREKGKYHPFFADTEHNEKWTDLRRWERVDALTAAYKQPQEGWKAAEDLKRIFYYAEYFGVTVDKLAIAYFDERVPINGGYDPTFEKDGITLSQQKKLHWAHLNAVGCEMARCRACMPSGDDGECRCAATGETLMGANKPVWDAIKNVHMPFYKAAMPTKNCPYRAE